MSDKITESKSTSTINKNDTIILNAPNLEAKIILNWDDGQWYISDIQSINKSNKIIKNQQQTTNINSGVKLANWDREYKYSKNDIVAYEGSLYVSQQNTNQGNIPNVGSFWWKNLIDLSAIDAITLEGKNLKEISRDILGGNSISDYYKKIEVDNLILTYFNNVNAKKLNNKTFDEIQEDYSKKIVDSEQKLKDFVIEYLNSENSTSFQQTLIDIFNENIVDDNVNRF